ncbi:hypothetical protein BH09ACT10_BH09ACT10_10780 [soil metagenome]
MERPRSDLRSDEAWLDEAAAWIREVAAEADLHLHGRIEVHRHRVWATTLIAHSHRGTLWFKANCPAFAFEPALVRLLTEIAPEAVTPPVAIDPRRGWMLHLDGGPALGDDHEPTTEDWAQIVQQMGTLQRALVGHRERLLATGLPDCAPATVVHRFDDLLELYASTPDAHPANLPPDVYADLLRQRPRVIDAAQQLGSFAVPAALQHGDLHPWNVFAATDSRGRHRVFDFGDAQWASPFEVLAVPFGWIAPSENAAWLPVLHAYREVWSDLIKPRDFDALFNATHVTHPINRAATWRAALATASPDSWGTWGSQPADHLRNLLEDRG